MDTDQFAASAQAYGWEERLTGSHRMAEYSWRSRGSAPAAVDVEMSRSLEASPTEACWPRQCNRPVLKLDLQFYNGPTRAFLNGWEVLHSTVDLRAGANDWCSSQSMERLSSHDAPGTVNRAKDIRYERPFQKVALAVSVDEDLQDLPR